MDWKINFEILSLDIQLSILQYRIRRLTAKYHWALANIDRCKWYNSNFSIYCRIVKLVYETNELLHRYRCLCQTGDSNSCCVVRKDYQWDVDTWKWIQIEDNSESTRPR